MARVNQIGTMLVSRTCVDPTWRPTIPAFGGSHVPGMATVLTVGKFISRLRPGDLELGDRIFAEAHRLYEAEVPASEAIGTLIAIAGDNPNAFMMGKNSRGLNKTPEGRAILRLVGTASLVRDQPGTAIGSGWWPP